MGGITRIHGNLIAPKNFAGVSLQDFTLTVGSGTAGLGQAAVADLATADGALDAIFRKATGTVGTVSRVGTLTTSTTQFTLRFAVESLGFEAADNSGAGFLGTGPDNEAGTITDTAGALQAAIRALGTVNSIALSTATVTAFTY